MLAKQPTALSPLVVDDVAADGHSQRRMLVTAIRAQRYTITTAMLQRSVRRTEVSVGLELVALGFVERVADALDAGEWSPFLAWVERTCRRHADRTVVARLLTGGLVTLTKTIGLSRGDTVLPPARIARLTRDIDAIANRPRADAEPRATDTLDEVDVLLGELIERLELADPGTADHSRAVSLWCARIAKRMSLDDGQTAYMMRCGLIHDIGKMTTPPEILLAPRRLSNPETDIMRKHAEDGAAIVEAVPLLAELRPAVRWHHERLDGIGYPDGLSGASIPLVARIVAVADSFNAMIGNRPYRVPLRPTDALAELWRHAGKQFDPDVIEAMQDVVTKRT